MFKHDSLYQITALFATEPSCGLASFKHLLALGFCCKNSLLGLISAQRPLVIVLSYRGNSCNWMRPPESSSINSTLSLLAAQVAEYGPHQRLTKRLTGLCQYRHPLPKCTGANIYAPALIELGPSDVSHLLDYWQVPRDQQNGDSDFGTTLTLFQETINGVSTNMVVAANKDGIYYAFDRSNIGAGPV